MSDVNLRVPDWTLSSSNSVWALQKVYTSTLSVCSLKCNWLHHSH